MKVRGNENFIGWPYDVEWVEKYVIPLVETYGVMVLTGKGIARQTISQGVKDKIEEADAYLFIAVQGRGQTRKGCIRQANG